MSISFREIARQILARRDLTSGAQVLFLTLLDRQWPKDYCYPSQPRMERDCGHGHNAVCRAMDELQDAGFVLELEPPGRGRGHRGKYRVILPLPPEKRVRIEPFTQEEKGANRNQKRVRIGSVKGADSEERKVPKSDAQPCSNNTSDDSSRSEGVIEVIKEGVNATNRQVSLALTPNGKPQDLPARLLKRVGKPVLVGEMLADVLPALGLPGGTLP